MLTLCPASIRRLLLTLLATALVLRVGSACEAMAATPSMPAAHQAHCADMPPKPDKPMKSDAAACALCITLPSIEATKAGATPVTALQPVSSLSDTLVGLARGPAPPPPKIA